MDIDTILPGLCYQRYEEIKSHVADLFETINICALPINAFEIAIKLGYILHPYKSYHNLAERLIALQKDGFSYEKDGETHVFYNDAKNFERQNWTIMHEIGHRRLGHMQVSSVAECEADFFAKYALIPPPLVNALQIKSPEEIQKYFIASRRAALNGFNYFNKWLRHHTISYTKTEERILRLFLAA